MHDKRVDLPPDELLEYCFLAACKKAVAEGFLKHVVSPIRADIL